MHPLTTLYLRPIALFNPPLSRTALVLARGTTDIRNELSLIAVIARSMLLTVTEFPLTTQWSSLGLVETAT